MGTKMNIEKSYGLYLYKKSSKERTALNDLLQFLRTIAPGEGRSFSYIEASHSLHPELSLWENLQLELGFGNWREFGMSLKPEQQALLRLLEDPNKKVHLSEQWEKLLISLLKALANPSRNLLIDMNEDVLSPFLIQNIKRTILNSAGSKTVYLASANTSLWLDCAHSIVDRHHYQFIVESLDTEALRKKWVA
jgi:hypothetical protein